MQTVDVVTFRVYSAHFLTQDFNMMNNSILQLYESSHSALTTPLATAAPIPLVVTSEDPTHSTSAPSVKLPLTTLPQGPKLLLEQIGNELEGTEETGVGIQTAEATARQAQEKRIAKQDSLAVREGHERESRLKRSRKTTKEDVEDGGKPKRKKVKAKSVGSRRDMDSVTEGELEGKHRQGLCTGLGSCWY